jgi:acyl carrier protein
VVEKTRSAPGGAEAATTAFRAFLREQLPEYMVPSAFWLLESLPHTANGKIDRKALPHPGALAGGGHGARGNYVAPTSKMEQGLSAIWREALNLPQVGIHDNFFDVGGHSLLMAQVHRRIREELKVELPLVKLLEHPTISSLAKYLGNDSRGPRSFQQSHDRAMKQLEKMRRHPPRAKG